MFNEILFNSNVNRLHLFPDNSYDLGPKNCMHIIVVWWKQLQKNQHFPVVIQSLTQNVNNT